MSEDSTEMVSSLSSLKKPAKKRTTRKKSTVTAKKKRTAKRKTTKTAQAGSGSTTARRGSFQRGYVPEEVHSQASRSQTEVYCPKKV